MWILIIVAILAILGGSILNLLNEDGEPRIIGILLILLGSLFFWTALTSIDSVTPLDVYRGKTELKITETRIDTAVIKRDSVVVFKEEYER